MTEAFYAAIGWCAGVLSLMTYQVYQAQRARHFMQYQLKPKPPESAPEWSMQELTPAWTPTPRRSPVVLEECPQCGKAYRRVSQHIRMSHKVTNLRTSDDQD